MWEFIYICHMSTKSTQWENVKLPKEIVDKLRSNKDQTGVSMKAFIVMAISEKLTKASLPKKRKP